MKNQFTGSDLAADSKSVHTKSQGPAEYRAVVKNIYKLFIVAGIFAIFGTAGSCDLEMITLEQTLRQLIISFLLILIGLNGLLFQVNRKKISQVFRRFRCRIVHVICTIL